MTDEEIMKALECCQNGSDACGVCPLRCKWNAADECIDYLAQNALNLINRQKAEIERLVDVLNRLQEHNRKLCILETEMINDLKSEAIREFAEKLKEKAQLVELADYEYAVLVEDIDNLVKEMTEVKDND